MENIVLAGSELAETLIALFGYHFTNSKGEMADKAKADILRERLQTKGFNDYYGDLNHIDRLEFLTTLGITLDRDFDSPKQELRKIISESVNGWPRYSNAFIVSREINPLTIYKFLVEFNVKRDKDIADFKANPKPMKDYSAWRHRVFTEKYYGESFANQ